MVEITTPGDITSIKIIWSKVHVGEVVWGCTVDVACEPYGSNDKYKYYQVKKGSLSAYVIEAKHVRQLVVKKGKVLFRSIMIWEKGRLPISKLIFSTKSKVQLSSARPKQKTVPEFQLHFRVPPSGSHRHLLSGHPGSLACSQLSSISSSLLEHMGQAASKATRLCAPRRECGNEHVNASPGQQEKETPSCRPPSWPVGGDSPRAPSAPGLQRSACKSQACYLSNVASQFQGSASWCCTVTLAMTSDSSPPKSLATCPQYLNFQSPATRSAARCTSSSQVSFPWPDSVSPGGPSWSPSSVCSQRCYTPVLPWGSGHTVRLLVSQRF